MATNIEKYTKQGSLVGITGQMQSHKYEKEGQTHFVSEILIESIKFMSPQNKDKNDLLFEPFPLEHSQNVFKDINVQNNDIYEIV
ncbi:putative single strand DNA binding protein [Staphylococcus saprophyticus subsp. saprophyticus KACC 16562]|nr:putative single strand DNA binding protein [Staphylococcus saprophyticus subsp. saprophyticus KACC 16562]